MTDEYGKKTSTIYVILISLCVISFMLYLQYHTPICFDGGMNFTVSRTLNIDGKYAADYQELELFASPIQTGGPVIFLTSLLNAIFGINSSNMQIVTTLFGSALAIVIFIFLAKRVNYFVATAGLLLLVTMPTFLNVSYEAYGETSMGFFLLVAFLLFSKAEEDKDGRLYFLSGAVFALAYLTKTIALIVCPIVAIVMLVRLVLKKSTLKNYGFVMLGVIVPVILFEIYKLVQFGFEGYCEWWLNMFGDIAGQAGITDKHTANDEKGIVKAVGHIKVLCTLYNINIKHLILMYTVPLFVFVINGIKKQKIETIFYLAYGTACLYFIWWTFMSPTTKLWPRRILFGMIMLVFVFVWAMFRLIGMIIKRNESKLLFNALFGIIIVIMFSGCVCVNVQQFLSENRVNKESYHNYCMLDEFLDTLPENSTFYGVEWLQNPTVASISGIRMKDISREKAQGKNCYYIQERDIAEWEQTTKNYVLSQYETMLIYDGQGCKVYQLLGRKQKDELECCINVDLVNEVSCIFSTYYTLGGDSYSATNCSVYHAHNEKVICSEIYMDDIDQLMLSINVGENNKEIIISNMTIKLETREIVLSPEEIYNAIIDSDEGKKKYLSFSENGELIIKVDIKRHFTIKL